MPIVSISINLNLAQNLNLLTGNFLLMYSVILPLNKRRKNVIISRLLKEIVIIYYNIYLGDFYYIS